MVSLWLLVITQSATQLIIMNANRQARQTQFGSRRNGFVMQNMACLVVMVEVADTGIVMLFYKSIAGRRLQRGSPGLRCIIPNVLRSVVADPNRF